MLLLDAGLFFAQTEVATKSSSVQRFSNISVIFTHKIHSNMLCIDFAVTMSTPSEISYLLPYEQVTFVKLHALLKGVTCQRKSEDDKRLH